MSFYILFAEKGSIRYDNILAAIAIGLAPFTLLRTTLFETHKGRAISFEPLYRKILSLLDALIMRSLYRALHARINIIAYYNSKNKMIQALKYHYERHPDKDKGKQWLREFQEELENEPSYFNRRRICAHRLLRIYRWDGVKAEGLVPANVPDKKPPDPQREVWELAKEFARDPVKARAIKDAIDKEMSQLRTDKKKRYAELKDFWKYELKNVVATEGELNVNIRFLFTLFGYNKERLPIEIRKSTE